MQQVERKKKGWLWFLMVMLLQFICIGLNGLWAARFG